MQETLSTETSITEEAESTEVLMEPALLSTEVLMEQALKLIGKGFVEPSILNSWKKDIMSNTYYAIIKDPSPKNIADQLRKFLLCINQINIK